MTLPNSRPSPESVTRTSRSSRSSQGTAPAPPTLMKVTSMDVDSASSWLKGRHLLAYVWLLTLTAVVLQPAVTSIKAQNWTPARTSWGDPDLQGTFSNGDEYATPLERPDQFAGRRLDDIKGEELVAVRRAELQQVIDGLPGGRVRGPDEWWLALLTLGKGNQAWLVVDPPDGKIPALTPQGRAQAGRVRSSFLGGP